MIRLMEEQFKTFGLEITAKVEEAVKAAGVEMEFVTLEWHPAEKILGFAEKNAVVRNAKIPALVVHGKRPCKSTGIQSI
jgi:hypothetical protein